MEIPTFGTLRVLGQRGSKAGFGDLGREHVTHIHTQDGYIFVNM